jgi:tripeptide aminopeptidase
VPSSPPFRPPGESVVDRFLRYVRIDTQSREGAPAVPSTPGQWTLARLLAGELSALGVERVRVSDTCIVYGMIPGNLTTFVGPDAPAVDPPIPAGRSTSSAPPVVPELSRRRRGCPP